MSGQSSSYTSSTSNDNIQADFEKNLQTQLDSIKKIQDQQISLYSKLEVLGASKNISDKGVQDQINDNFKQIETLNNVKNTIFESLLTSYQLNQSQLNASRYAYADSITALKIVEENLSNKRKILNEALAIRDNSERMVGVNTYYTRRYEEHSNVLKYIILFCGIIILAIFLMKIGVIGNTISSIIIIASLSIGIIIVFGKMWDLSRRSNIDYDRYNFMFDPNYEHKNTERITNVKTDMTYGGEIFGNICDKLSKAGSRLSSNIRSSVGDYKGASAANESLSQPPPPPPPPSQETFSTEGFSTEMFTGSGSAGSVHSFILKNPNNKFNNKKYNMDGCPLAFNDTKYNYSDYEA
jgi:hypothetical protein